MSISYHAQAGQGGQVTIACINKATVDLGVPFDKLTAALQKCYDEHQSEGFAIFVLYSFTS